MRYEYTVGGQRIALESDDDLLAVRFRDEIPRSQRAQVATRRGAEFGNRFEIKDEPYTIVRVSPRATARSERAAETMSALSSDDQVVHVAPVFKLGGGHALATERVLVRLKGGEEDGAWLAGSAGRTVERKDGGTYHVLTIAPEEDPLAVASELAADPRVEWAEPDFVNIRTKLYAPGTAAAATGVGPAGDSLMGKQYALRLTRAIEAWEDTPASPSVIVAVLDEGVDTRHEDLSSCLVGSFDAIDDDELQEPNPWDGHGTACAGLAVATGGNGHGVRGVATGCSLHAIRIAQSLIPGGPWTQNTTQQIARGIDWAWRRGAWILSNSWGGGAPSNLIAHKIEEARVKGRGGRGCVIVIAAGNDDGHVTFPANLPNVVAVAASNEFDEPKTRHSRDGETWWGSCFGPEIWVAAPGVHNFTTDITGAAGYNPGGALDASYISDFNGTSSATPIVAGVAALILSAAPTLSEQAVREILRDTADKVGGLPYPGGRNDRMGYGRVNALKAVQEAARRCQAGQ